MKKMHLIITLLIFSSAIGQTKIDDFFSVKFPGKVEKKDLVLSDVHVLTYYCNDNSDLYSLQKIQVDSVKRNLNNLPSDLESLKAFYSGVEKGFVDSMLQNGYQFQNSKEFKIDNYLGRHLMFSNLKNHSKALEARVIILNENMYTLIYVNNTDFNEKNKNSFLNSIDIDSSKNPQQMIGQSKEYKQGVLLADLTIYGLFIMGLIFLIKYLWKK